MPSCGVPLLAPRPATATSDAKALLCNPCLRHSWLQHRASPGLWPGPWWSRFCQYLLGQQGPHPDTWTVPVISQTQIIRCLIHVKKQVSLPSLAPQRRSIIYSNGLVHTHLFCQSPRLAFLYFHSPLLTIATTTTPPIPQGPVC